METNIDFNNNLLFDVVISINNLKLFVKKENMNKGMKIALLKAINKINKRYDAYLDCNSIQTTIDLKSELYILNLLLEAIKKYQSFNMPEISKFSNLQKGLNNIL
jgi:hypothetical protein